MAESTSEALRATLISPNVCDSNGENANVVDVLQCIANAGGIIANAITPRDAASGRDAAGGVVSSLTESVMGVTAGLTAVADALNNIADSIRERDGRKSP